MNAIRPQLAAGHPLGRLPRPLKRFLSWAYWTVYDCTDFIAEAVGWLPSHTLRLLLYRHVLKTRVGTGSSIHRGCRLYRPSGVRIGNHTVINRGVILDGRMGLDIGDCVSISEEVALLTLEHDPNSPTFASRGGPIRVGAHVFIGARAMVLPGVSVGEGAVVAAGGIVTDHIVPYCIVAGVPARPIGRRREDLTYTLSYHKFLG